MFKRAGIILGCPELDWGAERGLRGKGRGRNRIGS